MKIFRGSLKKEDIVYTTKSRGRRFISTVQCTVLPGEWAGKSFAGKLADDELFAEHSAAEAALIEIKADTKLMSMYNKEKGSKGKGKGKGASGSKGKGKGKGQGKGWGMMDQAMMMQQMMAAMMGMDPLAMMGGNAG